MIEEKIKNDLQDLRRVRLRLLKCFIALQLNINSGIVERKESNSHRDAQYDAKSQREIIIDSSPEKETNRYLNDIQIAVVLDVVRENEDNL